MMDYLKKWIKSKGADTHGKMCMAVWEKCSGSVEASTESADLYVQGE